MKSNAIVFCRDGMTLGVGAGQMSRIDSVRLASQKAASANLSLKDSVVASDAFFPFRDGLDALADAGAAAVIQPGGSLRDAEVIAAANERGVAMVEFKVSAEGTPYLMEVNGRFWGSLQLAIDAGVDFPWLLYQMAIGENPGNVKPYITGIKCRWLLGDLVSLWKVLINSGPRPRPLPFGKVESIVQFLNFNEKASRYEVNRWGDLKPFWLEVTQYAMDLGSGFVSRIVHPAFNGQSVSD